MRLYWDLKDVSITPGSNSGGDLKLSQVPAVVDGKENYVVGVSFRVKGTISYNAGPSFGIARGELATLVQRILLEVPGLRPLVNNVRGLDLVRLHRIRNKGDYAPGLTSPTTIGTDSGTLSVDFTVPVQFADAGARKYADGAIPARLLRDANLMVSFDQLNAISARFTGASLTLKTTVITVPRAEVVIPQLATLEAHDYAAGEVQPNVPRSQGKVSHLLVAKQRQGAVVSPFGNQGFATTDITTLGVRFGATQVSQDSLASGAFYGEFAEYATTDFTDHTQQTGAIDEGVPLQFPPLGMNGQHVTYETADASQEWRVKADAVSVAYSVLRREIWKPGVWQQTVAQRMGLPADAKFKPKTASKKAAAAGSAAGLPLKQV